MTDRLSLTNALADANIDRKAAERIATEILDAIHDSVATKQDLQHLEAALKADVATVNADLQHAEGALRADLQRVEADLRADLQRVEAGLRADLQRVEAALRADLQRLDSKVQLVSHQLLTRLGGLMVALAGLLFAALHYWPPHS